jgi:hypothetical protein
MQKKLDIEIAAERFRIVLENGNRRFLRAIQKYLDSFLHPSGHNGCAVSVFLYSQNRIYNWPAAKLKNLRNLFLSAQRRFPPATRLEEKVQLSLNIIRHFRPEEPTIQKLISGIDAPQNLVYALVGVDLILYDPGENSAFFFIKKRFRLAGMLTALINGIMCVLSHRLIHSGGLLLHGAALQKNDTGVLFLGLSGAGKSTITRLCEPDICFSDDGVVIKDRADGIYAYRSPFGLFKTNGSYDDSLKGEIQKIFLLEKSDCTRVLPIAKSELMSVILKHLIHFYKYLPPEAAQLGFYTVKEILERLPGYRLQFAKNAKIWDNIVLQS